MSSRDISETATQRRIRRRGKRWPPRYAHQRHGGGLPAMWRRQSLLTSATGARAKDCLSLKPRLTSYLSSACSKDWQNKAIWHWAAWAKKPCCVSSPDRPNIKAVYLCLDSDQARNDACSRLVELMPEGLTVRLLRFTKDWNGIADAPGRNRGREVYPGSDLRL